MARPILAFISLIFLAGAIVLQFFVILSGGINTTPENLVYFLQADTNNIPGARNPSRWTYWAICGVDFFSGHNTDCGSRVPALPFSPTHRTNFATTSGVPDDFIGTKKFYYMSRFAWVFFLVALLFSVASFLIGGLAICLRFGAYLSALNTFVALFFQTLAAALMTAWTVEGRNAFRRNGLDTHLGRYAYGFTWGSVAALFIATMTFCMAGGRDHHRHERTATTTTTRRRGFFRRHRRSVSRKEEYA